MGVTTPVFEFYTQYGGRSAGWRLSRSDEEQCSIGADLDRP